MLYRKLGRTGLRVSIACLGTMTFGSQVDEKGSVTIIRNALDAGINFLDTADQYNDGLSEEIVGKALGKDRDSIVLATKVGAWQSGPGKNAIGLSRKHIMQGIEGSLRRLGTEYVDIYYLHRAESATPLDETLRALDDLVHQGKVRYLGCSNFWAWQLCKSLWVSDRYNLSRFECVQPPYNLITRDIEHELLPLCESEGVGVCVYNPLAGGLLTGKHSADKPPAGGTRFSVPRQAKVYSERYWSPANFKAVDELRKIAEGGGHNLAQFSLAWIFQDKRVSAVILGATSLEQLQQNLGALEIKLTPEELATCNRVWEEQHPTGFLYGRDVAELRR